MSEIALVEVKKDQRLAVLTTGLDPLIDKIKQAAESSSSDIDTAKGRKEIVSNAFKVTKTKTYLTEQINNLIEEKNKEIEPTLKIISLLKDNQKIMESQLSRLSKDTRKTVTDWEETEKEKLLAEQEKIRDEKLAEEKDRDHEIANFMHDNFCREQAEAIEAERIEQEAVAAKAKSDQETRDKKIADDATAKAKSEAEEEKKQAIQDKVDAEEREKQAEISKLAAEKSERQQKIQAEKDAADAKIQAKKDSDAAAEQARLSEVKRQDDQKAAVEAERLKTEANTKHVGSVRREIKEHLMTTCKIDESLSIKIVKALLKAPRVTINYQITKSMQDEY